MPAMIPISTGAIGLATAAVVLADRTPPEIPGRGQLGVEPLALLFQVGNGVVSHRELPSGCLYHNQTIGGPASIRFNNIRVAHPFEAITSQEALDKIIGQRLAREKTELQKLQEQLAAETAAREKAEQTAAAAQLRIDRATAKGLPAALAKKLVGTTADELDAEIDELLPLVAAALGPVVERVGGLVEQVIRASAR